MRYIQTVILLCICFTCTKNLYSQNTIDEVFAPQNEGALNFGIDPVSVSPPPAPAVEDTNLELAYEIEDYTDGQCTQTCETSLCCPQSQTWVNFTPYLWATQTKGTVTVNGNTLPLNLDLSDLWNMLEEGDVRGAGMGHVEFGRDDWSIMLNADIVSLAPSKALRRRTINTGMTLDVLEVGMTRTIYSKGESGNPLGSPFSIQLLGGARYYSVDAEASITGGPISPMVGVSESWVDLFAGARIMGQIAPGVKGSIRGDWAGFGIGTSSQKTWNLTTLLIFDCNCECADLLIGYRILDIEASQNGGAGSPGGFGVDNKLHGPVAGLSFQF